LCGIAVLVVVVVVVVVASSLKKKMGFKELGFDRKIYLVEAYFPLHNIFLVLVQFHKNLLRK
jgi:hypothetical protein